MNKTLSNAIQPDDIPQTDYDDEDDHGQHDEVIDDENSQSDGTNPFGDTLPNHRPDLHSTPSDTNGKPSFDSPSSTSRLPFVPSNLWRELFAKPGILVGQLIDSFFLQSISFALVSSKVLLVEW